MPDVALHEPVEGSAGPSFVNGHCTKCKEAVSARLIWLFCFSRLNLTGRLFILELSLSGLLSIIYFLCSGTTWTEGQRVSCFFSIWPLLQHPDWDIYWELVNVCMNCLSPGRRPNSGFLLLLAIRLLPKSTNRCYCPVWHICKTVTLFAIEQF